MNNNKTSQAFIKGRVPWPRGKMLGGTSSINSMKYVRGNKEDYQSWKNAGNPNWTIKRVYSNFKKAESFQNQKLRKKSSIKMTYGYNGPQILNRFNSTRKEIYYNVLESLTEIGIKKVVDLNSAKFKSPGISSFTTSTAAHGQRYSTYQSYLQPVRERKNLKIITNAFVIRILINKDKRAYGVEVDICDKHIKVYADLEVILSAGTIGTPQLLMLSGVGPKHHLESKNISCQANLIAVGKHLQDQFETPIPIYTNKPKSYKNIDLTNKTIKYLVKRTGLLAEGSNTDIDILLAKEKDAKYPDFQFWLQIFKNNSTSVIRQRISPYNKKVIRSFLEPAKLKYLFLFYCIILHPLSRGQILLATDNPYDKPLIDANYFSHPRDLQSASDGIRMFTEIVNTTYFKSINAFLHRIELPECDQFSLNSDLYWQCQTKNTAKSAYHIVGTAKMGPNPYNSVVDDNLRVHIIKSLRVIDASVMPSVPSGNTNSPTIMVGEMGASMIKSYYNLKTN